MIENAADIAMKNSKAALVSFNCYVVQQAADAEKEAPNNELGLSIRPKSAMGTDASKKKSLNPIRRPSTSSGRLSDTMKSTTKKKKVSPKLLESMVCWHCKKGCDTEFVSIPPSAGLQYIGSFCGWECAKQWNIVKSPLQFRWIRNVLIDQAAGHYVEI
jgi:hypothetical protein